MITINGRTFAKNDSEFVDLLFHPGRTCTGFYKRRRNGVLLMDHQRTIRAFIVANPRQGYFAVTASATDEGVRYMFSLANTDEAWLGFDSLTYLEQHDVCRGIA